MAELTSLRVVIDTKGLALLKHAKSSSCYYLLHHFYNVSIKTVYLAGETM